MGVIFGTEGKAQPISVFMSLWFFLILKIVMTEVELFEPSAWLFIRLSFFSGIPYQVTSTPCRYCQTSAQPRPAPHLTGRLIWKTFWGFAAASVHNAHLIAWLCSLRAGQITVLSDLSGNDESTQIVRSGRSVNCSQPDLDAPSGKLFGVLSLQVLTMLIE